MAKRVDEGERKGQIAEAVLSIATESGLHAATVRAVSDRCGLSIGAIQHYFPSQAQLQCFSMELLAAKVAQRMAGAAAEPKDDPLETAAALLEQLLPLDDERMLEARVWAMFTTASLTNEDLAPCERQMDESMRAFCLGCVEYLGEKLPVPREADALRAAASLQALLDGLTLRLITDPAEATKREARRALREHLRLLCQA